MNYKKVIFKALDAEGEEIYHTNVMMALAEQFVVVCLECIEDADDKAALLRSFEQSNKEIIEISLKQVEAFAGNMLELIGPDRNIIVMSKTAYNSLSKSQLKKIEKFDDVYAPDIPIIEQFGGGSVRCMMAEVFEP